MRGPVAGEKQVLPGLPCQRGGVNRNDACFDAENVKPGSIGNRSNSVTVRLHLRYVSWTLHLRVSAGLFISRLCCTSYVYYREKELYYIRYSGSKSSIVFLYAFNGKTSSPTGIGCLIFSTGPMRYRLQPLR
jgi:hypothetical protein